MTLRTERLCTVDQINAFLEGSDPVDYRPEDRDGVYEFVRRTQVGIGYGRLGRFGKGVAREYLGKTTGLVRAQLSRLIGQYRATGAWWTVAAATADGPSRRSTPPRISVWWPHPVPRIPGMNRTSTGVGLGRTGPRLPLNESVESECGLSTQTLY